MTRAVLTQQSLVGRLTARALRFGLRADADDQDIATEAALLCELADGNRTALHLALRRIDAAALDRRHSDVAEQARSVLQVALERGDWRW